MGAGPQLGEASASFEVVSTTPTRRGCWGEVHEVRDTRYGRRLALKMSSPQPVALEQLRYRRLSLQEAADRDIRLIAPSAYLMPTWPVVDANGNEGTLMPWYDKFLNDVLDEAKERWKNAAKKHWLSSTKEVSQDPWPKKTLLRSGMTIDQVCYHAPRLAQTIGNYHRIYHAAHGDLKPNNIAVDEEQDIHVMADFGTATVASIANPNGPRDNMGCIYNRSPQLWHKGAHPKRSTDVYAFGCMLYEMFEGETPLQRDIDKAAAQGGLEAVGEFMRRRPASQKVDETESELAKHYASPAESMLKRIHHIVNGIASKPSFENRSEPYAVMMRRLRDSSIPPEFQTLIEDCLNENIRTGEILPEEVNKTIDEYRRRIAREAGIKEAAKSTTKKLIGGLGIGAAIAGLVTGIAWMNYKTERPDWSRRVDFYTMMTRHDATKVQYGKLQIERPYECQPGAKMDVPEVHTDKETLFGGPKTQTLVHVVADEFLRTAAQLGYNARENGLIKILEEGAFYKDGKFLIPGKIGAEIDIPWNQMYTAFKGSSPASSSYWIPTMEDVLEYSLGASILQEPSQKPKNNGLVDPTRRNPRESVSTVWNDTDAIDLEDACARIILSPSGLDSAKKYANSEDYTEYRRALNDHERQFIEQWVYNIQTHLPKTVAVRAPRQ